MASLPGQSHLAVSSRASSFQPNTAGHYFPIAMKIPEHGKQQTGNSKPVPCKPWYTIAPSPLPAGHRAEPLLAPALFLPGWRPLKLAQVNLSAARARTGWCLRARLCGICGSDLKLLKGAESFCWSLTPRSRRCWGTKWWPKWWRPRPAPTGGPGTGWRWSRSCPAKSGASCRRAAICARGQYNLCENFTQGELAPGTILGFTRGRGAAWRNSWPPIPAACCACRTHLPDEVAVLTDSLASALQPVLDHFPQDDDTVVIYGAGIIGQHLVRLLRALGSKARVIMVARYPFQEESGPSRGRRPGPDGPRTGPNWDRPWAPGCCPPPWGAATWRAGRTSSSTASATAVPCRRGLLALRGRGDLCAGGHRRRAWARWTSPASGSGKSAERLRHVRLRRLAGTEAAHLSTGGGPPGPGGLSRPRVWSPTSFP